MFQNIPIITTELADNDSVTSESNNKNDHIVQIDGQQNGKDENKKDGEPDRTTFTTMTPQEIAMRIDRRARFLFPVMFLAFNALYWTFVYCF